MQLHICSAQINQLYQYKTEEAQIAQNWRFYFLIAGKI